MICRHFVRDERGVSIVEFGITAPVFFLMVFALLEGAFALWTQFGLQHGVEQAARCASINSTVCGNADAITQYAISKSFGVHPQSATFTVTAAACGNQVRADYTYHLFTKLFTLTEFNLIAKACFPK